MRFCVVGSVFRASISWGRCDVVDRVCAAGCAGVGFRDGWGFWSMFTCGIPGDVLVGSLLASFKVFSGSSVDPLGALSSGAMCLVVSLI